jgi:hypothetical protein
MLVLMFDPRFKTMLLVTMYVGCEIIVVVVVEYDKELLLLLLMEVDKLLMLDKVETTCNLHSQVDFEGLFHTTTTITYTYRDIMSREIVGFHLFPFMQKVTIVCYLGGARKNTSFQQLFF